MEKDKLSRRDPEKAAASHGEPRETDEEAKEEANKEAHEEAETESDEPETELNEPEEEPADGRSGSWSDVTI